MNRLLCSIGLVATRESSPADGLCWLRAWGRGGSNVGRTQKFAGCFSRSGCLLDLLHTYLSAKRSFSQRFQDARQSNQIGGLAGEMPAGFCEFICRRATYRWDGIAVSDQRDQRDQR